MNGHGSISLRVREANEDEIYKDLARLHKKSRSGIESGAVCKITVNAKSKYLILRGVKNGAEGDFILDEPSRTALGVKTGEEYEFTISKAGWWGNLQWAWNASDPAYSIAAKLGILSFALGVISLILAVVPLFQ